VYPALAVLQTMHANTEVLWVGGEGGMEALLVDRAKVPFKTIPAAGLHGVNLKAMPGNLLRLVRGFFAARRILGEFKPDVLFFTGGYVAVPVALAGMRIPTALFVPDIEPGLALRTLARFADRIAVTAKESFRFFNRRERLVLSGYPVRVDLARWSRSDACQALHLTNEAPVLLILGGSKGSHSINTAVQANLNALLEIVQVVHITGELDWPGVEAMMKTLPQARSSRYHAFPYLHDEMGAALAAADLVVSRAGASTLGEYPHFGLPSILVPYPHAWRYQKVNAESLVGHGAAMVIPDGDLMTGLLPAITSLLHDPARLNAMRAAAKSLAHPQASTEIGHLLYELAGKKR
jgi:UDP-N-acetylglucosamine--N-acetylmuramyl-(pentapeptide) pyrophosphoryl-undecaprenol N-acetylglucosamine transferase